MGLSSSTPFQSLFKKGRLNCIMIGLDNAGKTTIMYQLKVGQVIYSIPTIGFDIQTVEYKNVKITNWDVGGAERIRRLQQTFYSGVNAIICVMDASDTDRHQYTHNQLWKLLDHQELQGLPVLIFLNKKDISKMTFEEVEQILEFKKIKGDKLMQWSCAITGEGLLQGFQWLMNTVSKQQAP